MERSRKQKLLMIFALVISIASLSVGFAAFSVSLNISSSTSVSVNSDAFIVKFSSSKDSLVVSEIAPSDISDGITAGNAIIDNSTSPLITNLTVTFTEPGQFVEYVFYARNEGEYTAYLNSINLSGEKSCTGTASANVQSACDSISMKVMVGENEYTETTEISGHSLAKKSGEEIRVRIDYASTGGWADAAFRVSFPNIMMVYSTIDDSSYVPTTMNGGTRLLIDEVKKGAELDTDVRFVSSSGLSVVNNRTYLLKSTVNNNYPIYYYRGNVTNNNVRFANFCWKIVRTTDTGGIKLIYNGVSAGDGSCNNTGTASQIGTSPFNNHNNSPADVGYMYGDIYTVISKDLSSQVEPYLYGNNVSWDGEKYTLVDTISSSSWANDKVTLSKRHHYTCFNATGVCENVYYVSYFGEKAVNNDPSMVYYLTMINGENIENVKIEMFSNTTNSVIKIAVDSWYESNMTSYTEMLEDTVWCNDRTLTNGALSSNDAGDIDYSRFGAFDRNYNNFKPSVICKNRRDSFTVDTVNGNGNLIYPVGLLTADEYTMAGSGYAGYSELSYLYTGQNQWSLSPYNFGSANASVFGISSFGSVRYLGSVNELYGIRPSVSLKAGTLVSGGNGSASNPYVIE